jgi:hypothetical protein
VDKTAAVAETGKTAPKWVCGESEPTFWLERRKAAEALVADARWTRATRAGALTAVGAAVALTALGALMGAGQAQAAVAMAALIARAGCAAILGAAAIGTGWLEAKEGFALRRAQRIASEASRESLFETTNDLDADDFARLVALRELRRSPGNLDAAMGAWEAKQFGSALSQATRSLSRRIAQQASSCARAHEGSPFSTEREGAEAARRKKARA